MNALSFVEHTGNVLVKTATRDVTDGMDVDLLQNLQYRLDIDPGGCKQHVAERVGQAVVLLAKIQVVVFEDDLTHKGKAVGVNSCGCKPHKNVTHLNLGAVNELGFLDSTHGKARNIVLVFAVHVGHLGGLATNESAIGHDTAVGHALDDSFNLGRVVLPHSNIIEEEKRSRTLGEHIIDAHGHGILSDGVVLVHHEGDFQFGAHTVGAADQDGFLVVERGKVEHAAKTTNIAHHARPLCGGDMFLDASDRLVASLQCYASLFV